MPYRKPHLDCSESNCQSYSAYIRVKKKWVKAGEYNSKCRAFTPSENVKTYDEIQDEELRKHLENNPFANEMLKRYGVDAIDK